MPETKEPRFLGSSITEFQIGFEITRCRSIMRFGTSKWQISFINLLLFISDVKEEQAYTYVASYSLIR